MSKLTDTLKSRKFQIAALATLSAGAAVGAKVAGGGHLDLEDVKTVLAPLAAWAMGEWALDMARTLKPAPVEEPVTPANTGPKRITTTPSGRPLVAPAPIEPLDPEHPAAG